MSILRIYGVLAPGSQRVILYSYRQLVCPLVGLSQWLMVHQHESSVYLVPMCGRTLPACSLVSVPDEKGSLWSKLHFGRLVIRTPGLTGLPRPWVWVVAGVYSMRILSAFN